jgi:hypothetical protein
MASACVLAAPSAAFAEPSSPSETPVDVQIPTVPPPRRVLAIEWNPVSLFVIGKLSFNAVIVPVDHHALILSPFYAWTTTQPIYVYDSAGNSMQLPQQKFTGFGGEIGYRYYTDVGGPRGIFVGPSLIVANMNVQAQNGQNTGFFDLGVAVDVGYEAVVADTVTLTLGAGAQYSFPDKSIPSQQFPADVYANAKFWPRALASIGWAF